MTRYDPTIEDKNDDPIATMEESRTGDYVLYDDVVALVRSIEESLSDFTSSVEREFRYV